MYHNSLYTDEIQSSVYQEDSHVMDYIAYLKCYYKAQFTHPGSDEKWPNIQIYRYIELSIAKDCQFSRENALQFSLSSVKKGIDELVSKKETIGLRGIACLHANGAHLIEGVLIIGAPAIGKTSLVRPSLGWAQFCCSIMIGYSPSAETGILLRLRLVKYLLKILLLIFEHF